MSIFDAVTANAFEPAELTLDRKGMNCVNWECDDAEFEFVGGDDKVCRVHSILAEFLSPKVARLRRCDISFAVYTFKNSELFNAFESLVSSLRSGAALRVEKSNFAVLFRLSQELENTELFISLLSMIKTKSLSLEEAILLFRTGIDLGTARSGNLRDFIASRFYEIEKEILDDLDLETTQVLLSSPSLKLEDEDSLYDFIRSRSENDLRFTSLFEFISFRYLSANRIEHFSSFVSENFPENINFGLWVRVCSRLIFETKPKRNPRVFGIELPYNSSKPLDGIIAHLTRECGGNVHDNGIVNVTASSWTQDAKSVADLETSSPYVSSDGKDTWICYDFKQRGVIPTRYLLKTYGSGHDHLKSWVIEVSNDGASWTEIDRRNNDKAFNARFATRSFKISKVPCESFRFFRLRQSGRSHFLHDDYYSLTLIALEIFGTLCDK